MTELLNLAKKGTITADMDGTIEEIYVSDEETSDSSSVSAGSGVQLSNMSYTKGTGIQALNMSYTKSYGVQASNMYYTNESVVRIVNVSDTDETAEIFSDDTGSMEEIPSQPEKQTLYLSMADTSAGNAQMLGILFQEQEAVLRRRLFPQTTAIQEPYPGIRETVPSSRQQPIRQQLRFMQGRAISLQPTV